MAAFILLVVIIVAFVFVFAVSYNQLVRLRQRVRESWSGIDTELKRRYDLIPNLVETVKGYVTHEKETLNAVIAARNAAASNNGSPESQAQTEGQLNGAVRQLFALAESYPDLKANQNFLQLQGQLAETEGRLATARQSYNSSARDLNTVVQSFPAMLIAGPMGFKTEPYFEVEDAAVRQNVQVKF